MIVTNTDELTSQQVIINLVDIIEGYAGKPLWGFFTARSNSYNQLIVEFQPSGLSNFAPRRFRLTVEALDD